MRRFDKLKNIQKINLLTEQRYLNKFNENNDQDSLELRDDTFLNEDNILNDISDFPGELYPLGVKIEGYDLLTPRKAEFIAKFEIELIPYFVHVVGEFEKDGYDEDTEFLMRIKEVSVYDEVDRLIAKTTNKLSKKFENHIYDSVIDKVIKDDQDRQDDYPG